MTSFNQAHRLLQIDHFPSALEAGGISGIYRSYAENKLSGALPKIGRCNEAQGAAEPVLAMQKYGNAKSNWCYAK